MKCRLMKSESGQAIILMALALVVLMAFAAVTIDLGMVSIQKGKLQNAIDAAALAAAQVLPDTTAATAAANQYVQLNGYLPADITITFSDSNYRVKIAATKTVPYTFAQVLGITEATVNDTASAKKEIVNNGGNFAIFSGSKTLPLSFSSGWDGLVKGGVHTNHNLYIGIKMTITGPAEAALNITSKDQWTLDNSTIPIKVPNAPVLDMPQYPITSTIPSEPTGVTWTTALPTNVVIDKPIYYNGNFTYKPGGSIRITGNGCIIAKGNVTLGGGGITIDTSNPVAVQSLTGTVTFENTTSLTGSSSIYAEKAISFSGGAVNISSNNPVAVRSRTDSIYFGNTLTLTGTGNVIAYNDITMVGDTINIKCASQPMLYAQNGKIDFRQAVNVTGTVYAPKGQIRMVGGSYNVKGSLIADNFYFGNAVNFEASSTGGGGTTTKILLVE